MSNFELPVCIKCGSNDFAIIYWFDPYECRGERYLCFKENGEDNEKFEGPCNDANCKKHVQSKV
jgi:hypothetical protein